MKGLYQSVTLKNISFHGFWLFQTLRYHRTNRPFNWCVCLIVVWKIIIELVLLLCFTRRCFLLLLYIFFSWFLHCSFQELLLESRTRCWSFSDARLKIIDSPKMCRSPSSRVGLRVLTGLGARGFQLLQAWTCDSVGFASSVCRWQKHCCRVAPLRSAPAWRWDSEQRILIFHSVLPGPIISRLTSARVPRQMQVCLTSWSLWKRNIVAVLGTNGDLQ